MELEEATQVMIRVGASFPSGTPEHTACIVCAAVTLNVAQCFGMPDNAILSSVRDQCTKIARDMAATYNPNQLSTDG